LTALRQRPKVVYSAHLESIARTKTIQTSDRDKDGLIIDPDALERLRRLGGQELLSRMIELFDSHVGPVLEQAAANLEADDFEGVRRAAHSIRSSAGNVGASQMRSLAERIEVSAPAGNRIELQHLVSELRSAYDRARVVLDNERS
jgi:HPt (histidine-containing phosphotransfer) domain-containing protein